MAFAVPDVAGRPDLSAGCIGSVMATHGAGELDVNRPGVVLTSERARTAGKGVDRI